jgi:2-methylcitrate dehydratase
MKKISVSEDEEFTRGYRPPGSGITGVPRYRLIATSTNGETFTDVVGYHRGHSKNPMTREHIDAKFDSASSGVLDDQRRDEIRAAWWGIGDAADVADLLAVTADFGGRR